jgi:uncharacterized protein
MTLTAFPSKSPRMEVVDALRGFAILAIMLLHNLEHFDFYYFPEYLPQWMKLLDGAIWDTLFFLFAGKSYSIFSLLFGFTFYIMFSNQQKKGKDFRGRFMWRSFLLLIFGIMNSVFYQGDILFFYAILGFTLVIVCKWSNKAVLITAIVLMLQPLEWVKVFSILNNPLYTATEPLSYHYFGIANTYLGGSSFWTTAFGNLTNGKMAVVIWSYENGRFFQTPALFMLGMLIGRKGLFVFSAVNYKWWKSILGIAAVSFVAIFACTKLLLPQLIQRAPVSGELDTIFTSWSNFAFTIIWVSGFVVLFQKLAFHRVLSKLQPFGRMSLTNYVMQSIIGSFIYYGFGLGLYKYTGATFSLLIGILLFIFQFTFSRWWMKNHVHGPLEGIWHKLTWI